VAVHGVNHGKTTARGLPVAPTLPDGLLRQKRWVGDDCLDHSQRVWAVPGQGVLVKVEELKADEVTTQEAEEELAHARMLGKHGEEVHRRSDEVSGPTKNAEVYQAWKENGPRRHGCLPMARLFMG